MFRLTGWIQPIYQVIFPLLAIAALGASVLYFISDDVALWPVFLFLMLMFLVAWLTVKNLDHVEFDRTTVRFRKFSRNDFVVVDFEQIENIAISSMGLFTTIYLKNTQKGTGRIKTLNGFISAINFNKLDALKINKAMVYEESMDDTLRLLNYFETYKAT